MQFLYYHKDTTYGSFHITNTNIRDILAEIQPDDIIDAAERRILKWYQLHHTQKED